MILEAEPELSTLLRSEWPKWVGPTLPTELINAERGVRVLHGQLAFRADASDDVVLFHVRRAVPADQLSAREREVAEAFASGASYLELAQTLKLAPNTVRRHLSNIYEKLGISSKAELEKMIRDSFFIRTMTSPAPKIAETPQSQTTSAETSRNPYVLRNCQSSASALKRSRVTSPKMKQSFPGLRAEV